MTITEADVQHGKVLYARIAAALNQGGAVTAADAVRFIEEMGVSGLDAQSRALIAADKVFSDMSDAEQDRQFDIFLAIANAQALVDNEIMKRDDLEFEAHMAEFNVPMPSFDEMD